jgi:hypothetical protein
MVSPEEGNKNRVIPWDILSLLTLLLIVLLLFFPYFFEGKTVIPYDLLYSFPPWESLDEITPQNTAMMDLLRQHIPWRIFNQQTVLSRDIPFWNPYSSGGMPFMANGLSQVLYPPNILLLLLTSVESTFTLFLFIHLVFTGWGMYFLLRRINLGSVASLVGSLTWMLSGYLVVWLPWPPNIATIAWLPWAVLTVDWLLRSGDIRSIGVLGICVGMTILGGHLQYAYYILLVLGFLVLARLLTSRKSITYRLIRFSQFALGVLLGIMLSSLLLFSMFELSMNDTRGEISINVLKSGAIPIEHLYTLFLPDIFGDANNYLAYGSYPEFTGYIGLTGILLCLLSLLHPNFFRRGGLILFLLLGGVSLHLAYGGWLNNLFGFIPGYTQFRGLQRFLSLWSFGAAGMVAYGIETILLSKGWRHYLLIVVSIMLIIIGCFGFLGPDAVKSYLIQGSDSIQWDGDLWNRAVMLIVMTASVILISSLLKNGKKAISDNFILVLFILTAVDLFSFGKGYLPTVDPLHKYPMTEGLRFLISHSDEGRIARFGEGALESPLTPNVGIVYGLHDIDVYDSFSIDRYNQLVGFIEPERYQHISSYNTLGNFQNPSSMNSPLMDLLGVRFLLSRDPIYDPNAHQVKCNNHAGELIAGSEVGQTFKISQDGLYRVDISIATFARLNEGKVMIELRQDSENGQVLAYQRVDVSTLPDNEYFVFTFPQMEDSGSKVFYVGLVGIDGEPGNAITVWLNNKDVYASGTAFSNKSPIKGDLCFRAYSINGGDSWLRAYAGEDMLIYENLEFLPKGFFVSEINVADSDMEQRSILSSTSFKPHREAVINLLPNYRIDPYAVGTIQELDQTANRIEMDVQVDSKDMGGSLLVLTQSDYPGWRAWVDDEEVEILQTNFALQGIVVPDGFHHVNFIYRPNLYGLDLVLTSLGLMGVIIVLILPLMIKRASREDSYRN